MSYCIDSVQFDLTQPVNKYWFSKYKKSLLKNQTAYLKRVIDDAVRNNHVTYSPQYYSCAKFISKTTNLKFKKTDNVIFYIRTFNDDFLDYFEVDKKTDFECTKQNKIPMSKTNLSGGKKIGKCTNGCCWYYCKTLKKFNIQWGISHGRKID